MLVFFLAFVIPFLDKVLPIDCTSLLTVPSNNESIVVPVKVGFGISPPWVTVADSVDVVSASLLFLLNILLLFDFSLTTVLLSVLSENLSFSVLGNNSSKLVPVGHSGNSSTTTKSDSYFISEFNI